MINFPPPADPTPDWKPDPSGRFELRYWNGGTWTDDVSSAGQTGKDDGGAATAGAAAAPAYGAAQAGYGGGGQPVQYGYGGGQVPATADVGSAFNYGWEKFTKNVGPILGLAAVAVGVTLVWSLVAILGILPAVAGDAGFFVSTIIWVLLLAVGLVLSFAFQIGIYRAALGITEGRTPSFADFTRSDGWLPFFLTTALVWGITAVGFMACFIPGLVAVFFLWFAPYFTLERRLSPVESVKASVNLVNQNLGSNVIFVIACYVAIFIGQLLCGIGVLVAFPVVQIATAYFYKALNGQPVAA